MNLFFIKNKFKGFALITVLWVMVILLVLMTSLIDLTALSLYRSSFDLKKNAMVPIAESAINEIIINMEDNLIWGTGNEKLYMTSGKPDLSSSWLRPSYLPAPNSKFTFEGMDCYYYVSFDPNDLAFGNGVKYFSVNNLNGVTSVYGWKGQAVPPHTADIVVTTGYKDTITHVEVLLSPVTSSNFESGSRGHITMNGKNFKLTGVDSSNVNIHSNYSDVSNDSININADRVEVYNNGTLSACGAIEAPGFDANSVKSNQSEKEVPALNIQNTVSSIAFEPVSMPSGTYEYNPNTLQLKFTSDLDGSTKYYSYNDTIVPGVKFVIWWFFPVIRVEGNIKVAYDSSHSGGTGNLNLMNTSISLRNGSVLYAPGDSVTRDGNDGKSYSSGNITTSNTYKTFGWKTDILTGTGSIYAMGDVNLEGSAMRAGRTDLGGSKLALYTQGDVNISAEGNIRFHGLCYCNGDFKASTENGADVNIDGALIVAGKDSAEDPKGEDPGVIEINSDDDVNINIDNSVLGICSGSGGGVSGFKVLCWYEF